MAIITIINTRAVLRSYWK